MALKKSFQILKGNQSLELLLPEQTKRLQLQEPEQIIKPGVFCEKLDKLLTDLALDLSCPMLVLADKTRLCGYPEYLPLLIDCLIQHGMKASSLKIIIGYGTHPRQSDEECHRAYGDIYNDYSFIHHECIQKNGFIDLGTTSRNTPIRYRHDLLEASSIITMGAISHHYFAGYGGGRKLIFPGCGERESIYTNHSLYVDSSSGTTNEKCQPGILDGNPLAEDLFEIEDALPANLSIHGILDSRGTLCNFTMGHGRQSFIQACSLHSENCEVESPQFDTVIASCGGFPKDINFIQSHKAIHNASMFVRDGGLLLIYGECTDGVGSQTFLPWFEMGSFDAAFQELSRNYQGNGGTALAMMTKLQRIRIAMVTSLDEPTCQLIGLENWSHENVTTFLDQLNPDESVAFVPNASLLVKSSKLN